MPSPAPLASPLPALSPAPLPASVVACLRDAHAAHVELARRAFDAAAPDAMGHLGRSTAIRAALYEGGLAPVASELLRQAARCHAERPGGRFGSARQTAQAAAVAYAALLDRLAKYDREGEAEEVLAQVGELLGGLSCGGFVADLDACMDGIEADLVANAGYPDVWPNRGGNDPDAGVSAELQDRIADAQDNSARSWLRDASAIMAAPTAALRSAA